MMKVNTQSLNCSQRKTFESLDLMKFICAILVVAIHISPFGQETSANLAWAYWFVKNYFTRIAVPFFFMCTGFQLFRKLNPSGFSIGQTAGYIKKTYRLYLLWVLIYMVVIIPDFRSSGTGFSSAVVEFIRRLIFAGGYAHLWYLNAAAFAVLLISLLMHKKVRFSRILALSFGLYLFGLLFLPYYGLIEPLRVYPLVDRAVELFDLVIMSPRDGLFEGFFFVSLGAMFAYKPICMPMRKAVTGFAASMLLMLGEVLALSRLGWTRGYDTCLFLAPASFFLFYIVSHIDLKEHSIYRYLRTSSSLIYFSHYLVGRMLRFGFNRIGIDIAFSWMPFPLTVVCSMLVGHVIIRLSQRARFGWLKRLYS